MFKIKQLGLNVKEFLAFVETFAFREDFKMLCYQYV